ncbi:MAG: FAD:protein FMN transferase [Thermoguttaceae bacterium]|nr:FAD:protein FMN transferase [Thermoguttaceae bacterium]MDW8078871.1 FAD:protein FMN transferase [Thermoguttaceae bacterium]
MGSQFEVILPAGIYPQALDAVLSAFDVVQDLEKKLSYFLPDSEVSCINQQAGVQPVSVSEEVWEVISESLRAFRETDGAFDITSGPLWRLWGFARKTRQIPSPDEIREALSAVGSDKVVLEPQSRSVYLSQVGAELNLGGIGKGFALDRALRVLRSFGIECVLVSGGYSSVLMSVPEEPPPCGSGESQSDQKAIRNPSDPCPMRGALTSWIWEVGIRDPLRPEIRVGVLRLKSGAIGTSGSALQFFRHEGKRLSHIIDPRTGHPVGDPVLAVTVLAPTATWADVLSTAFFIQGPDWAEDYCRRNCGVAAIFALTAENPRGYVWRMVGSWPEASAALDE